ncbi:MAG: hypothetical protein ACTSQQ_08185 [Candidatus Helarchaeota archaeon]
MVLGPTELTFLISSGIMLALFIVVFYKLCKNSDVHRSHKIVYAIIFPGIVVLGCVSIFVFNLFMDWREALMFNIVWIPLFLLMLQDLSAPSQLKKLPFSKLFLAVALTILLVFCLSFILIAIIYYLNLGIWIDFLPIPIFIILVIIVGPLFVLTARIYGQGEAEFSNGEITSGGITFLYLIGFTYGLAMITMGFASLLGYETSPYLIYPFIIIGMILFAYCGSKLIKERRKRKKAGYGL